MILIDGSYLYGIGKAIQNLEELNPEDTLFDAYIKSHNARNSLDTLVHRSIYIGSLKFTSIPAKNVVRLIDEMTLRLIQDHSNNQETIDSDVYYRLRAAISEFETIFKAEFQQSNLFLATPKGGYDLQMLIQGGENLFPPSLSLAVPEAIHDVREGTKCLAFELYTAAGFHLHRANECVVLRYFDSLAGGKQRPKNRNMGVYIKALEDADAPKQIISCLRDLKDMHRNPLMHPEQSIENLDDAIALLNSIYTAMSAMLKSLPQIAPPPPEVAAQ